MVDGLEQELEAQDAELETLRNEASRKDQEIEDFHAEITSCKGK